LIPFIILVIITILYFMIKSSKKMRWDDKTYMSYDSTKYQVLLPYIQQ
jgi:hypothetical protein